MRSAPTAATFDALLRTSPCESGILGVRRACSSESKTKASTRKNSRHSISLLVDKTGEHSFVLTSTSTPWQRRRSALMRSRDCGRKSPKPVKRIRRITASLDSHSDTSDSDGGEVVSTSRWDSESPSTAQIYSPVPRCPMRSSPHIVPRRATAPENAAISSPQIQHRNASFRTQTDSPKMPRRKPSNSSSKASPPARNSFRPRDLPCMQNADCRR